jgi:hypothetical protein
MDHICRWDADCFTCEAGIGQIAGVTPQEMIGSAATDAVELNALPD